MESPRTKRCLAKSIPKGEILTDLKSKKWKLGPAVGIGGFGEIYLASDDLSKPVLNKTDYVIKVEPFMSGPLFVEIHVYAKIGKKDQIEKWKTDHRMKALGMPYFLGCGSHYFNNERYRFIVLPKYGVDLQTVFLNNGRRFSVKTAFTLASYVIDVLEYIHSKGYVHADIKASNLMLNKENTTPVYLLDYGLSCKFYDDVGNHKKLESDQRKAHNGTLVFTSRDAHVGAHSRRGDLEVLGYNIIQWITGSLPWEGNTDAEMVAEYKNKMMSDLSTFIEECFSSKKIEPPEALVQYLKYVNRLKFKSKPDYGYCRSLFKKAVRDAGYTFNGDLSLNVNLLRGPRKRFGCSSDRENKNKYKFRKPCAIPVNARKPCAVRNYNPRLTRKTTHNTVQFDWPKILAGNPEKPNGALSMYEIPQEPKTAGVSVSSDSTDSANSEALYTRGLDNPTPQMKLILEQEKCKEKVIITSNNCNSNVSIGKAKTLRSRSKNISLVNNEQKTNIVSERTLRNESTRSARKTVPVVAIHPRTPIRTRKHSLKTITKNKRKSRRNPIRRKSLVKKR